MTGGADGIMYFWDFEARSKIRIFNFAEHPICCATLSQNGDMMAYALGNDFHLGPEGAKWKTKLAVHMIPEN